MEAMKFINQIVHSGGANLPFIHDLKEEGQFLLDRERAQPKLSAEAMREECERQKIITALEKEKAKEFNLKKRHEQLAKSEEELRELNSYIRRAKVAKDLVSQLRLEDEQIERRFEEAKKLALELRAEYRVREEEERQKAEQKRLENNRYREEVQLQIEEHVHQRIRQKQKILKEGMEMREKMAKFLAQERLEYEAALVAKQQWRQEVLENIRKKQEFVRQQKNDDTNIMLEYFRLEKKRFEMEERKKEEKRQELERRTAVSASIGARNFEVESAKEQELANIYDWFVLEKKWKDDKAYNEEIEKENQLRRVFQKEFSKHEELKKYKKDRQDQINRELALKRKPLPPDEQDNPPFKPKTELERLQLARNLIEKAAFERDKAERIAEAKQKEFETFAKFKETHLNNIQDVKNEILNSQPVSLLRYLPSHIVRTDYIPQPLNQEIRKAVREDPIPMLTKRRHQPHTRCFNCEELRPVNCCKTCSHRNRLSNIF